jgi:hypothetical protein
LVLVGLHCSRGGLVNNSQSLKLDINGGKKEKKKALTHTLKSSSQLLCSETLSCRKTRNPFLPGGVSKTPPDNIAEMEEKM